MKAKFYLEPHLEGGNNVDINFTGHMNKMATRAINSKNHKKSSSLEQDDRFQQNLACHVWDIGPSYM